MRILVITWEYPPYVVGGMGKHVAELIPQLGGLTVDGERICIDVLTTAFNSGALVESVSEYLTVYRVDLPQLNMRDLYNSVIANNDALIEAARQLAQNHTYDLIHIHDWLSGAAGIALKLEWKVPLLATIHATERGRHQGYLANDSSKQIDQMEWRICFEAWRVIVCSKFMAGEVESFFLVPRNKIDVIANGIGQYNVNNCTMADQVELRRRYAPNGEHLLFFIGRIVYEKGIHVLIRAMPHILTNHPNTRLLIAGKNSQQLWPLAREMRVDNQVEFLGFISNEQRDCLYRVVDSAVFPSLYEPFGIVALEAMYQSCNVIASGVGGLAEVVRHAENGLTVYPNDPQSIAWAVNELITHPSQAQMWRIQAQQEVNTLYRWDRIAMQTANVYAHIYGERQQIQW